MLPQYYVNVKREFALLKDQQPFTPKFYKL